MTRSEKKMIDKHLDLIFEFEKYVLEHPDFAKRIPQNAIVSSRVRLDRRESWQSLASEATLFGNADARLARGFLEIHRLS